MKNFLILGLVFLLLIVTVTATTDEQLNEFFRLYSKNFEISTVWAGEATTPSREVAKLGIVSLKWTDLDGQTFEERRFYASFKGARHFDDGKEIKTMIKYPEGTCGQKAPDESCGVTSFTLNYMYDYKDKKYYYHKYDVEVDPETGQATGGIVKEIIIDATFTGKFDIEDSPPNIQNNPSTLPFVNQNGIISEKSANLALAKKQI